MERAELKEVLDLVREKLSRDSEAACGILWADAQPTTKYAVGEEDATTEYAVGEEDAVSWYGVGEQ
ncbi:MAG: hypothetical protein RBU45_11080 [Myxococcota bacterium]|jgi:hypothetical protein|nr:hypothetical protein [Myxococcota bacterium]